MAESDELKTYKLQLQQVEAALTADPENEELLKLQSDLQEVIALTSDLIASAAATDGPSVGGSGDNAQSDQAEQIAWKVGDTCMALYADDGQHYEALIEEMLEDNTCTVTFTGYNNSAICPVSQLKPMDHRLKRGATGDPIENAKKSKKDLIADQREYKRRKSQKKAQRRAQLEEEHESDKNKWLDFNIRTFSKTSKGKVKKSIFATPDSVGGKVGVGTCGSGGKPMTSYQHQEKWKK